MTRRRHYFVNDTLNVGNERKGIPRYRNSRPIRANSWRVWVACCAAPDYLKNDERFNTVQGRRKVGRLLSSFLYFLYIRMQFLFTKKKYVTESCETFDQEIVPSSFQDVVTDVETRTTESFIFFCPKTKQNKKSRWQPNREKKMIITTGQQQGLIMNSNGPQ